MPVLTAKGAAGSQGGVLIQMSTGDTAHLEAALDAGFDHLRTSTARAA